MSELWAAWRLAYPLLQSGGWHGEWATFLSQVSTFQSQGWPRQLSQHEKSSHCILPQVSSKRFCWLQEETTKGVFHGKTLSHKAWKDCFRAGQDIPSLLVSLQVTIALISLLFAVYAATCFFHFTILFCPSPNCFDKHWRSWLWPWICAVNCIRAGQISPLPTKPDPKWKIVYCSWHLLAAEKPKQCWSLPGQGLAHLFS